MSATDLQILRDSLALKSAKCGLWDWEIKQNIVYFCPNYFLLAGYEPDEFAHEYNEWAKRVHPDDIVYVEREIERCLDQKSESLSVEFRFKTKTDDWMWLLSQGDVVEHDTSGKPVRFIGLHTDISRHKHPKKERWEATGFFGEMIIQAPIPMVVTNALGNIECFNKKFTESFGYTLDDVSTGEQWWEAAYPDEEYRQLVQKSWGIAIAAAAAKGVQIETQEWDITCKNGAVRRVEFDMMPLGEVSVIAMNDITEKKKAEAILQKSYEDLDSLICTLSHDLRSPLTPIIGYVEFLRDGYSEQLGEKGLHYLEQIEMAGEGMLALMEGLLSLSQAEGLKRPAEPIPTHAVVDEVVKNLGSQIASAGVELQLNELPFARIPKVYLTQIFDNLIGNAVRYGGASGECIEVGGEHEGKFVRFFVRDHGPGLSEEEHKHVFGTFYRAEKNAEIKGTGVGLAVVQKIARNCGGHAWSEETPGGGCTFWVEMEDMF
jgi:PAS domain S-box-containing protein